MISADDSFVEVWGLLTDRASVARGRFAKLQEDVTRELERRPFRTLALAAGAGFLLAGGLFTRFSFRLISFGARLAVLPVVAAELAAVLEADTPTGRPNSRRSPQS
jgi:hypothetical protein